MPHPALRGYETSGDKSHYPKPEPGLPNYCQHESTQPCPTPPPRGASPREVTDIILSQNQGSLITASMNPRQPCQPCPGMSPVATGSGGPSGLEDSPYSPRAKTGNARSPQIKSVLCCTQVGEPSRDDRHCLMTDPGLPDRCLSRI